MSINTIKQKILNNRRLTRKDGIELYRSNDLLALGRMATHVARHKNGNRGYFVQNMHINPTNICVNRCKFCAFSRSKGEPGAYEMTIDDILNKARGAGKGVREFHIVSGLHPDLPFTWYLDMLSALKKLLLIMMVMMVTSIAVPVYAALITNPTGTSIAGATFIPSANVTISITSTITNYSATSAHASSRTGAGYQFWILNTYNGVYKAAYNGEASDAWPAVVSSPTATPTGTWN